jgi:hypothetical protein
MLEVVDFVLAVDDVVNQRLHTSLEARGVIELMRIACVCDSKRTISWAPASK